MYVHCNKLHVATVRKHARTIRDDESSMQALKEDEQEKLDVRVYYYYTICHIEFSVSVQCASLWMWHT